MQLTSITGYDTVENFQSADVDGGEISFDPADIGRLGKQVFFGVATGDGLDDLEQFSQEFRLSGEADRLFSILMGDDVESRRFPTPVSWLYPR